MNFAENVLVCNHTFPKGGIKTTYKMPPVVTQKVDQDCYPSKSQDQFPAKETTPRPGEEEEAGWPVHPRTIFFYISDGL